LAQIDVLRRQKDLVTTANVRSWEYLLSLPRASARGFANEPTAGVRPWVYN